MGFLAKASALFVGLRISASFHEALKVSPAKEANLKAARRDIRNAIRAAAIGIKSDDRYWAGGFVADRAKRPAIVPKFFTQGSVAYNLLVDPCHRPPQQIDLDDGMYVSVDYLQDGTPALVAKALFELVEEALRPLCRQRGWVLDDSKDTCVRVVLDRESHIDIPIYSAPRDLTESISFAEDAIRTNRIAKRAGRTYVKLPSDKIMLAHRCGTWEQSDPLRLQEWVEACAARYGDHFRRACRYLKGWRDFSWERCCLSSITIMAAVAEAFEDMAGAHRGWEDDRVVYEVAQRLPAILRAPLVNPAMPGSGSVLNDWDDDDAADVDEAAEALAEAMRSALTGTAHQDLVVKALRQAFGDRIPNRPDMVEVLPTVTASVVAAKAKSVPIPNVTKSTSG